MDTLFIYNLADLSRLLAEHYDYAEPAFWQRVNHQLRVYNESGVTAPQRLACMPLHSARVATEALLTRKLRCPGEACRHLTTNPLCAPPAVTESC